MLPPLLWSPFLLRYLLPQVSVLRDALSSPEDVDPACSCLFLEVERKNNPAILNALLRSLLWRPGLGRAVTEPRHSLIPALGAQRHHACVGYQGFSHKGASATIPVVVSTSGSKNSHFGGECQFGVWLISPQLGFIRRCFATEPKASRASSGENSSWKQNCCAAGSGSALVLSDGRKWTWSWLLCILRALRTFL